MMRRTSMRRPWILWVTILVDLGILAFAASGFAMAASFAGADPARLAHWQHLAYSYLGMVVVALAVLAWAIVLLFRRRARRLSSNASQSA